MYSLQQGIYRCEESASAFVIFGYFKVYLEGIEEGQEWGNLALSIIGNSSSNASARARMYLFGFLYFWYIPIRETRCRLYETYIIGMRCGDIDRAIYALALEWRCQFFGGEKLSIVKSNYEEYMKIFVSALPAIASRESPFFFFYYVLTTFFFQLAICEYGFSRSSTPKKCRNKW